MKDTFKNLKELIQHFSDEKICRAYLEHQRWNGKPRCPHCGNDEKIYKPGDGKTYKCGNNKCYKKFTVTKGTIFENTNVPLSTWFAAIYIITAHKKGISSHQLARDLTVTQKTAWFINHRIREMLKEKEPVMLKREVQADESYFGGKAKNKHKNKRQEGTQGRSTKDKTPVVGLLEKDGKVIAFVVKETDSNTLHPIMRKHVEENSTLVTDAYKSYRGLEKYFNHVMVKHHEGQYVTDNHFHTNNIENFWSLFKRGIVGIYHFVSEKHLQRYCEEFGYRYNTRKTPDNERFTDALARCEGRLKYIDLIGKIPLPPDGWKVDTETGEVLE